MGMTFYDALVILEVVKRLPRKERALTLGVPTLNFTPAKISLGGRPADFQSAAEFLKQLGFRDVDAVDISDYEGANIVGDLNDPRLADKIGKQYDLVYDAGTIEHIFDVTAALRTINDLVTVGGAVVHATPTNGFVDHGFWQVSPDLFRAFYAGAGYDVLTSAFLVLGNRQYALPAAENIYRNRGRSYISKNIPEALAVFAAYKPQETTATIVKMQDYYNSMHTQDNREVVPAFFLPFGSPMLGRVSRNRFLASLINSLAWVRAFVRGNV